MRIIGLGNDERRDDGAGRAVVRRLQALGCAAELQLSDGEPTRLLDWLAGADRLIIVDAMRSGAAAGYWQRLSAAQALESGRFPMSSHHLGLAEVLSLARSLKISLAQVEVIGIEAADLGYGAVLTPAVAAAVEAVATELSAQCR